MTHDTPVTLTHGYFPKLWRATEQLKAIDTELGTFVETELDTALRHEFDAANEWCMFTWRDVPALDEMCGVHIGEFIHNVRSALDHLMFNLVFISKGHPGAHTQFAVKDSAKKWDADIENRQPEDGPGPTAGLTPRFLELLKSVQPFVTHKRGTDAPLAKLVRLSNLDKHRLLVAGIAKPCRRPTYIRPTKPGVVKLGKVRYPHPLPAIENGPEFARVPLTWVTEPDPEVGMNVGRMPVLFAFGERGKRAFVWNTELTKMLDAAWHVLRVFEPFLGIMNAPLPQSDGPLAT